MRISNFAVGISWYDVVNAITGHVTEICRYL